MHTLCSQSDAAPAAHPIRCAGLGKLANLSNDYVDAVAAVSSLKELRQPAAAVPFNADSSMGSAAPAYVSMQDQYAR
jgi:hypothetical protein